MKRAIATTTIPGNLGEKMRAAAHAGFGGIEIFENDLLYFDRSPAAVRALANDLGLEIVAWQPFRDFESLPAAARQRAFDRAERKFDLMGELGARLMLVCSNVSEEAIDDAGRAAADLAALAERAAARDLAIGYEALAWGRHVRDFTDAWSIVRAADQSNLGVVLDAFHFFCRGNSLAALDDVPVDRIALVQLADAPDVTMDPLQLSRHFRCFPGQGEYPVARMMASLLGRGFDGIVSHEIFSDEFRSGAPAQVAVDGMRSMLWLEDAAAESSGSAPIAASAPAIRGVEFVEFAAEGGSARWLAGALEAFGFRETHRHASKDVSLYRQGDINLIINREPEGFAHTYHERHGTSVCAVALGSENVDGIIARATRYRCPPVENRVAAGEMEIPALRRTDGSLLYLVDRSPGKARFFEVDFEPLGDAEHRGIGLERIDHLGHAVGPSEYLSTVLFHRAVLGFEVAAQVDVVDPHGMIFSRVLSSPDRSVRFPMSTSHADESTTARFRARVAGSGVQQIALSTANVVEVARRLQPEHVLPIPDNYYADLRARFALDAGEIELMRTHRILYDENAGGRFRHLFTRSVNGVFFEIVQRDGYDGYGEANAPVRIAAQQREYDRVRRAVTIGTEPRP